MNIRGAGKYFLTAGIDAGDNIFLSRRIALVSTLLTMTCCLFLFFTFYNFNRGVHLIAVLDFAGFLASSAAIWTLYVRKNHEAAINICSGSLFLFFLALASANQNNRYGLIWTIFFPIFVIFLKGGRTGLILTGLYYMILIPMSFMGIGEWQSGAWDLTSSIRFSFASLVATYSAYFSEATIELTFRELQKTRDREKMYIEELESLSVTDQLTGLYNRRFFDNMTPKQLNRAWRAEMDLVFFLMDVDCFKQYNDTYGHQAGDGVLQNIGKLMKSSFQRGDDMTFRIGGEEFAGVIVTRKIGRAMEQIEHLRRQLMDLKIPHKGNSAAGVVTASFGVSIMTGGEEFFSVKTLYERADKALYKAKENGRNRIVVSYSESDPPQNIN